MIISLPFTVGFLVNIVMEHFSYKGGHATHVTKHSDYFDLKLFLSAYKEF